MNAFKKTQSLVYRAHVENQDKESPIKVGDTVRFCDQWRPGVLISGVVTEVGRLINEKVGHNLRVRPVTEKGIRREFHITSCFVQKL